MREPAKGEREQRSEDRSCHRLGADFSQSCCWLGYLRQSESLPRPDKKPSVLACARCYCKKNVGFLVSQKREAKWERTSGKREGEVEGVDEGGLQKLNRSDRTA